MLVFLPFLLGLTLEIIVLPVYNRVFLNNSNPVKTTPATHGSSGVLGTNSHSSGLGSNTHGSHSTGGGILGGNSHGTTHSSTGLGSSNHGSSGLGHSTGAGVGGHSS